MRALPGMPTTAVAAVIPAPAPAPAPAAAKDSDELEALKPVPVADEKPVAEVKPAAPKPAEVKPPPPAAAPKPVVAEVKPAFAPVAAKPPPPKPAANPDAVVPATGGGTAVVYGQLNLRASDTADVFVDGKKVGGSPVLGHKVKPGKHKVRFDCYDASGESRPGVSQTYEVIADAEKDVEYDCPTE